jgi:hypothetical protein
MVVVWLRPFLLLQLVFSSEQVFIIAAIKLA